MASVSNKGATLTELLEIAEGKLKTSEDRSEAELFFDELSIVSGPNWVDDRLVYWKYLNWCGSIKRLPVDRKTFIRGAQKRFKRLTANGRCYFKLNKEVFSVSKEEWNEVLQDYNIEKRNLEWRRNQKKAQKARRQKERKERRDTTKQKTSV